jgi:hypothetical protein
MIHQHRQQRRFRSHLPILPKLPILPILPILPNRLLRLYLPSRSCFPRSRFRLTTW